MGDSNEIRWLQTTANDLNNLLQVISESSKALKPLCESSTEALRYYAFMSTGLERAQRVTADMAVKLGGLSEAPAVVYPVAVAPAPVQPEPALAAPQSHSSIIQNPSGSGELIMVIDDEKVVLDLASAVLVSEGYRVIAVTDVFKALSFYADLKNEVSLVILDYTMPIMDGSEVFEELKAIRPDAPIMLSSGFAEQEKVRSMLARGLRGFLPKPYTKQKLLSQVRSTLDAIHGERTGARRVL
jgi:CheY-like chemotaxis protein